MIDETTALAVPTSVKARRKKRGWTQAELAHETGLSTTAIHNLEAGKNGFTDKTLASLARALDCRPADLLLSAEDAQSVSGEDAIKKLLLQIKGLPISAIGAIYRMVQSHIDEAAESHTQTLPRDRPEPANRRRGSAPSGKRPPQRAS